MAPASIETGLFLFTPASKVAEDSSKITVRFDQLFLRFLAIASGCAHDHGDLQVGSRCLDQFLRLLGFDAENFLKRVREYRRFKNKNPDYLHDIWFQEIKKIFARLQERGGRVEPLDRFLGRDGVDIIRVPISERDRK